MRRLIFTLVFWLFAAELCAAVTAVNLTSGGDSTFSTSHGTASISPGANKLITLAVFSTATATITASGNGLTYVQVATVQFATDTRRVTVFRAMGASPTSGAVTITASANSRVAWSVDEFSGIDTTGTNGSGAIVQSVTASDTGTTYSATLAAFADAGNATYGASANDIGGSDITPGSGFTELSNPFDEVDQSYVSGQVEWKATNDTSVDVTGASRPWGFIAAEIKASGGAAAVIRRRAQVY